MLELLRQRRSIRKFQPRAVEPDKLELLLEAVLRSPSSRGLNPWEFLIVTEPDRLKALAEAKAHGSEFLGGAPLAVVVTADPQRCDVWVEDCSIAAIILQLTAESLGLGSCWVQIRERYRADGGSSEEYLRQLLGLPAHYRVGEIVGIGYPAEKKAPHPKEKLPAGKIHFQNFGQTVRSP